MYRHTKISICCLMKKLFLPRKFVLKRAFHILTRVVLHAGFIVVPQVFGSDPLHALLEPVEEGVDLVHVQGSPPPLDQMGHPHRQLWVPPQEPIDEIGPWQVVGEPLKVFNMVGTAHKRDSGKRFQS